MRCFRRTDFRHHGSMRVSFHASRNIASWHCVMATREVPAAQKDVRVGQRRLSPFFIDFTMYRVSSMAIGKACLLRRKSVLHSLNELGVDKVDLLLMHWPDAWTPDSTFDSPQPDTTVTVLDTWCAFQLQQQCSMRQPPILDSG